MARLAGQWRGCAASICRIPKDTQGYVLEVLVSRQHEESLFGGDVVSFGWVELADLSVYEHPGFENPDVVLSNPVLEVAYAA